MVCNGTAVVVGMVAVAVVMVCNGTAVVVGMVAVGVVMVCNGCAVVVGMVAVAVVMVCNGTAVVVGMVAATRVRRSFRGVLQFLSRDCIIIYNYSRTFVSPIRCP